MQYFLTVENTNKCKYTFALPSQSVAIELFQLLENKTLETFKYTFISEKFVVENQLVENNKEGQDV